MAEASRQLPKFPWDYDVPDTPFWNTLDHNIGRAFYLTYTDAEISQMQITFPDSFSNEEKIKFLRDKLNDSLLQKERDAAPLRLKDVDYKSWSNFTGSISSMDWHLGDLDATERSMRERWEAEPIDNSGQKNKSVLGGLAGILEKRGQYAEAEGMALESLAWISGHPKCGPNSPQALGNMRTLVNCVWKQGRYSDAQAWIEKCERSIEEMGKTDFKKYVKDEEEELERVVKALEQWKLERSAKF